MPFNIKLDYRYDAEGFFDAPERRAALEEAARLWEDILKDEFVDIPAGVTFEITNPSDGATRETITTTEAIDDLLIFVGADDLPGSRLAQAGPDGFSLKGDMFRSRITDDFRNQGPSTDFEPWVGTITFDTRVAWSFDLKSPVSGKSDFISTAMHEMGHIFGFGTSAIFSEQTSGGGLLSGPELFVGPNALLVTNGEGVPIDRTKHVEDGFRNNSVLMDPTSTTGARKLPTDIDKAMLADIGWEIDGFTKIGSRFPITTQRSETVFGSDVADVLNGLGGDDRIQGDAGNDVLRGGAGSDVLFGQSGRDIFVLGPGDDETRVADFDLSSEVVRLIDSGFNSVTEVLASVTKPFSNVSRITISDGSFIDISHNSTSGTPLVATNIELVSSILPPRTSPNNDRITLGPGDEVIDGQGGTDTVVFGTNSTSLTLQFTRSGDIISVDRTGAGGTDRLRNVEVLEFPDGRSSLDLADFGGGAALNPAQFTELAEMYVAYFNRAADAFGLSFWADKYAEGLSLKEIAEFFFDQPETRALYPNSNDAAAFTTAVYQNVLGRTPDQLGFEFWTGLLNRGAVSQGEFVLAIIRGAKAETGSVADAQYLAAKADIGIYFSSIKGMSDTADARQVMEFFGDQAISDTQAAIAATDGHFADATAVATGELLIQFVGVINDPFAGV